MGVIGHVYCVPVKGFGLDGSPLELVTIRPEYGNESNICCLILTGGCRPPPLHFLGEGVLPPPPDPRTRGLRGASPFKLPYIKEIL